MKKVILIICVLIMPLNIKAESFSYDPNFMNSSDISKSEKQIMNQENPINDEYKNIVENKNQILYVNYESGQFAVYDKKSDYYWLSTPQYIAPELNEIWTNNITSAFNITYVDENLQQIKTATMKDEQSTYKISNITNGVKYELSYLDGEIYFEVNIILNNEGLNVSIDPQTIRDSEKNMLVSIQILPYMGSGYEQMIQGYVFNSYNGGALTEFKQANNTYNESFEAYYMNDITFNEQQESELSTYMYGIVHGHKDNAMYSYIVEGEQDGKQVLTPAGYLTNYTAIYNEYNIRYLYTQQLSEEKNITNITPKLNSPIEQQYVFLANEKASYDQIAIDYKNYLKNEEILTTKTTQEFTTQLNILSLTQKEGILKQKAKELTTFEEMQTISEELKNQNIKFTLYNLFDNMGNENFSYSNNNISKKVEGERSLNQVNEEMINNNHTLSIFYNFENIKMQDTSNENLSKKVTKEYITFDEQYAMLNTNFLSENVDIIVQKLQKHDIKKIDVMYPNNSTNMEKIEERYNYDENIKEFNKKIKTEDISISNVDEDLDVELMTNVSSSVVQIDSDVNIYFDEYVPINSIILSGYVTMYSENLNDLIIDKNLVLKMIEYNVYPSFIISSAQLSEFENTSLEKYSLSNFEYYKQTIIKLDEYLKSALGSVENLEIVAHEKIEDNVVKITYNDGQYIVINYNANDITTQYGTIKEKSYIKGQK